MEIMTNGAVEYLTFGRVKIPIRLSIHQMTDDIRHLSRSEHKEVLKDIGIVLPSGMNTNQMMLMVMSFVQISWYDAKDKDVPHDIRLKHEKRLDEFMNTMDDIKRNGPPKKAIKQKGQLEIPGCPDPVVDPREVLS